MPDLREQRRFQSPKGNIYLVNSAISFLDVFGAAFCLPFPTGLLQLYQDFEKSGSSLFYVFLVFVLFSVAGGGNITCFGKPLNLELRLERRKNHFQVFCFEIFVSCLAWVPPSFTDSGSDLFSFQQCLWLGYTLRLKQTNKKKEKPVCVFILCALVHTVSVSTLHHVKMEFAKFRSKLRLNSYYIFFCLLWWLQPTYGVYDLAEASENETVFFQLKQSTHAFRSRHFWLRPYRCQSIFVE